MALFDENAPRGPQGRGFALLHDPKERDFLLAAGDWEIRWPPGHGFGAAWVLAGLWHIQLWHPRRGASVLVAHRSRWIKHHEIFIPGIGRQITRSPSALYALLDAHALTLPSLDRINRVAALGYHRAVCALSANAAATAGCPTHRRRLASC